MEQVRALARQIVTFAAPLIAEGALAHLGAETHEPRLHWLAQTWALLRRHVHGNDDAEDALRLYERKPNDLTRQTLMIDQIVALFQHDPAGLVDLQALVTDLQHIHPSSPPPQRTHAQTIGDEAEVGTAIAGDVHGNVTGINYGTIHAFFGTQPPQDAKELLDDYLTTLIAEHQYLRLGKLLGKDQTGREQLAFPALSLRAVYTTLATNARIVGEAFTNLDRKSILDTMDSGDPTKVLPDQVRLPVLRATDQRPQPALREERRLLLGSEALTAQWTALRRAVVEAPETGVSGYWYHPALPFEVAATPRRLVLLGSPGSGKSTVLRYETLALAEKVLAGDDAAAALPIPFFCQLGRVAQQFGTAPDSDLATLIDALMHPVVGVRGLRAGLRDDIVQAWRRGNALLCLDGLDEVPGTAADGTRSLRERMAEAIRKLVVQLSRAQVVVTCRTKPYEQDAAWQLRDDWALRTLEPFTPGQVRHFVPAWYAQTSAQSLAKYTPDEAQTRAAQLVAVLERRSTLADLTASPLLLTMITLLHYNKAKLPDERAEVYEEIVLLLLDRWEGVRSAEAAQRVETIGERLGLPHLTTDDLRPALHAIAFVAHQQAVDGRGVLTGELLRKHLDEFFALKLKPNEPRSASRAQCVACSDRLIAILREDTGLIQEEDDDRYVLPHLTFEEYLAACHLAGREDVGLAYTQWREGGDRWREVIVLLMGRLRRQEKFALAFSWLDLLVAPRAGEAEKSAAQHQRDVVLAAACYDALGRRVHLGGRAHDVIGFEERLRAALVELLEHPDATTLLPQRLEAGEALGWLGDPRYPVTREAWHEALAQRTEDFGSATGYWCYVRPGSYRIGGWDKDEQQHTLTLPATWIARYPITVAQYAPFVEEGHPDERWWTPEGWKWKQKTNRTEPWFWNDSSYNRPNQPVIGVTWYEATAFCAWLSAQCEDDLPDGYVVRLPTEAEWEAAAAYDAAMQRHTYPWGADTPTPERAIFEMSGLGHPAPIGCCVAGAAACGARDMAGNVWEVMTSSRHGYPKKSGEIVKDVTPDRDDFPWRGGAYYDNSIYVHWGARGRYHPDLDHFGLRVVVAPRLAQ